MRSPRLALLWTLVTAVLSSGCGARSELPVPPRAAISAGNGFTCAVTTAGAAKCWGGNPDGQLGNGTTSDNPVPVPVDVVGLSSGIVDVSAGDGAPCALTVKGAVECWGDNTSGQLGKSYMTLIGSPVPVDVMGLSSGVVSVSVAGGEHTCAVTATGAVECWGGNVSGQLGDGSKTSSPVPVGVTGLSSGVVAVSAGTDHTCALTATGAVECWGVNLRGQLGDGSTTSSPVPVDVVGLSSGIVAVSAGCNHTCALTTAGAVECWGDNSWGELGNGSAGLGPVPVTGLSSGIVAVSAGCLHTCALTTTGGVECWGGNVNGQLGNGFTSDTPSPAPVPVDVMGLSSGVLAVSAGADQTCAVTTTGAVECWGANDYGQLGDGSTSDSPVPVPVVGL